MGVRAIEHITACDLLIAILLVVCEFNLWLRLLLTPKIVFELTGNRAFTPYLSPTKAGKSSVLLPQPPFNYGSN
jgi:hypothetical protein